MYALAVLIVIFFNLGFSTSLASKAQYVIVKQHVLLGWSQELKNVNQIQCLLVCSRKAYCFSVNYNHQAYICQMNQQIREDANVGDFLANSSNDYMEKVIDRDNYKHGVYFISGEDDYDAAVDSCNNTLGSIASYEQLYNAFQPRLNNCTEGWLISGEIAFTEITDACTLKPPEQRSNVFPCKSYHSGVYCHRENNSPADTFDYLPKTQRIIRLTDSNWKKLNAEDAETCCRTEFNGQLATPLDVYNHSLSLGVNLCVKGWLSGMLVGNPCKGHMPPDFWLYPAGNNIHFKPLTKEYSAFCFVPLANQSLTYIDPYPTHRVMNGRGESRYSLNYYDADTLCNSRGGRMATRGELEFAHQSGYDCCHAGWVTSGEGIYPVTQPRSGCSTSSRVVSWGNKTKDTDYLSVYCYMP